MAGTDDDIGGTRDRLSAFNRDEGGGCFGSKLVKGDEEECGRECNGEVGG